MGPSRRVVQIFGMLKVCAEVRRDASRAASRSTRAYPPHRDGVARDGSSGSREAHERHRRRGVSGGELQSLLAASSDWLKPVVIVASWTAIRAGEIPTSTWDRLDLREGGPVFLCSGKPLRHGAISSAFARTRRAAGLYNVRFRDLRHASSHRWCLDGHDYSRIEKATGHKTMVAFERYNTVDEVELAALVGRGRYHNFITAAPAPVASESKQA